MAKKEVKNKGIWSVKNSVAKCVCKKSLHAPARKNIGGVCYDFTSDHDITPPKEVERKCHGRNK